VSDLDVEGWGEYRKLVISTLERLEAAIKELRGLIDTIRQDGSKEISATRDELRTELTNLKVEFSMQKVRISFIGAIAGSVPGLIAAIVWWLSHGR